MQVNHESCYLVWRETEDLRRCGVSHHNKFTGEPRILSGNETDGDFERCAWCHEWVDLETNLALPYELQAHGCWWCQTDAEYRTAQCMAYARKRAATSFTRTIVRQFYEGIAVHHRAGRTGLLLRLLSSNLRVKAVELRLVIAGLRGSSHGSQVWFSQVKV